MDVLPALADILPSPPSPTGRSSLLDERMAAVAPLFESLDIDEAPLTFGFAVEGRAIRAGSQVARVLDAAGQVHQDEARRGRKVELVDGRPRPAAAGAISVADQIQERAPGQATDLAQDRFRGVVGAQEDGGLTEGEQRQAVEGALDQRHLAVAKCTLEATEQSVAAYVEVLRH